MIESVEPMDLPPLISEKAGVCHTKAVKSSRLPFALCVLVRSSLISIPGPIRLEVRPLGNICFAQAMSATQPEVCNMWRFDETLQSDDDYQLALLALMRRPLRLRRTFVPDQPNLKAVS